MKLTPDEIKRYIVEETHRFTKIYIWAKYYGYREDKEWLFYTNDKEQVEEVIPSWLCSACSSYRELSANEIMYYYELNKKNDCTFLLPCYMYENLIDESKLKVYPIETNRN